MCSITSLTAAPFATREGAHQRVSHGDSTVSQDCSQDRASSPSRLPSSKLWRSCCCCLISSLSQGRVSESELMRSLVAVARKNDMTDKKTCRPANELAFMADVYACYLESSRVCRDLATAKRGREATVEQAARSVGLQLPVTKVP